MDDGMIRSVLDNDLYKLTMQQAVHALYPRAEARYVFANRAGTHFPDGFSSQLISQVNKMAQLAISETELSWLARECPCLTPAYLDFLSNYRFHPDEVEVTMVQGQLHLNIEGPWFRTILWEVPLMAMVSELYFQMTAASSHVFQSLSQRNRAKAINLRDGNVRFVDFGTRRRFSAANHEQVIADMLEVENHSLIGTSNAHFARRFEIRPVGTHAHEWFMFHGAINGYDVANQLSLDAWTSVYKGNLGIALTDTYTTEVFLRSFNGVRARLYDGVRQDSGDPIVFAERMVKHYQRIGVNPLTKTIVFSDGLTADEAIRIQSYCEGKIDALFGIGTHLTNDVGPTPLNMVIKLSECRADADSPWIPAVKLSDSAEKFTGTPEEIDLCLRMIERGQHESSDCRGCSE